MTHLEENRASQPLTPLLAELERNRFYGSIELKFEAGRIVLLRKTEMIKPDYRDNRDTKNERTA